VKLFRARAWRDGPTAFDPLDASGSVGGPLGWRFNDIYTPIIYTAEVEPLATLEVAVRPGWESIQQVLIAIIEIPDGQVVNVADIGIVLPSNWNARPVAPASRAVAREFLNAIAALPVDAPKPMGLRVPSVLSGIEHNVLLDPSRIAEYTATVSHRSFNTLRTTKS
jgi:RES domain-containing protein